MNLDARVGQVWELDESVELIVSGVPPKERITEVRWNTLVLWSSDERHTPGSFDQAGEGGFASAEKRDNPTYRNWSRIL